MSRFLLDTTTLIDFSKRREPAFSLVYCLLHDGDEVGVSPINVAEFYAGLGSAELEAWDAFFEPLSLWPIGLAAAKRAGRFRYEYRRRGMTLSATDTLVAAVALEQRETIVTNNVKDYPMDEIVLLPTHEERA